MFQHFCLAPNANKNSQFWHHRRNTNCKKQWQWFFPKNTLRKPKRYSQCRKFRVTFYFSSRLVFAQCCQNCDLFTVLWAKTFAETWQCWALMGLSGREGFNDAMSILYLLPDSWRGLPIQTPSSWWYCQDATAGPPGKKQRNEKTSWQSWRRCILVQII